MNERTSLIVNADDYGLTAGVNRAIEEAHLAGIVTSTTVLATGEAADEASALPRSLSVGAHLNLTLGRPILDPGRVPTLVDAEGRFHSRSALVRLLVRRKIAAADVYGEAAAQLAALRALGIEPTHWDTHLHVAEMPQLARAIGAAAKDAGIRRTRTPRLWITRGPGTGTLARMRWRTASPNRAAGELARALSRRILARNFAMPDYRFAANGVDVPGSTYAARWDIALANLPAGTCEIPIHPAYLDDQLRELTPNLTTEREVDLAVATSPRSRALLTESGAILIPYTQLGGH